MNKEKALSLAAAICSKKEHCSWEIQEKLVKWEIPEKETENDASRTYAGNQIGSSAF